MKRARTLRHEFVEFIPSVREDSVVYVSIPYATAVHNCCCGCGSKVVTPISPTDWKFTFDGETISLYPSIGNWSLPCRSHYCIINNMVKWAPKLSKEEIERSRHEDALRKEEFYKRKLRSQ